MWKIHNEWNNDNNNNNDNPNLFVEFDKNTEKSPGKLTRSNISKLATIVEGDPKAPFSIATTPRCRGGRYSIPRIAPLYPWTVPYNAEC